MVQPLPDSLGVLVQAGVGHLRGHWTTSGNGHAGRLHHGYRVQRRVTSRLADLHVRARLGLDQHQVRPLGVENYQIRHHPAVRSDDRHLQAGQAEPGIGEGGRVDVATGQKAQEGIDRQQSSLHRLPPRIGEPSVVKPTPLMTSPRQRRGP